MKRANYRYCCILVLTLSAACSTTLDRQWSEVNTRFRDANRAFLAAAEEFIKGADEIVANKHFLQQAHIDRDWDDFFAQHSVDGQVQVSEETLRAQLSYYTERVQKLHESQQSWEEYKALFTGAIQRLRAAIDSTETTEKNILAARESVQAYMDSAVKVVGGVAAGALAAP